MAESPQTVTEQSKREFLQLVVEKETTKCWSWMGDHDADHRPVFRSEKAYRVMYELRIGDIPSDFHVHHKCGNSSCVNPRHLVALSAEAHRAVHATADRVLKQGIYRGEWEEIQAAKAKAARVAKEKYEQIQAEKAENSRLDREAYELNQREKRRIEAKEEEENRQLEVAVERWQRDHPLLVAWGRAKCLMIAFLCAAPAYLLWQWTWSDREHDGMPVFLAITFWFIAPLAVFALAFVVAAFGREAPITAKVRRQIKEALISSRPRRDG
jgi:hypothetical protein